MTIDGEQLEARLTSHGVYITRLERDNGVLKVEYESIDAGQIGEIPHQEMGRVINVYRDLAEEDGYSEEDYARIEATVTGLEGEFVGTWYAKADWLRALADEDLSEVEFSSHVLDTIDHDAES